MAAGYVAQDLPDLEALIGVAARWTRRLGELNCPDKLAQDVPKGARTARRRRCFFGEIVTRHKTARNGLTLPAATVALPVQ
jgi:hypothetical protein